MSAEIEVATYALQQSMWWVMDGALLSPMRGFIFGVASVADANFTLDHP